MIRIISCLLVCCWLAGCGVTADNLKTADLTAGRTTTNVIMQRRFVSLRQIKAGMSPSEVASLLGVPVVVGYELVDPEGRQYKPLVLDNPRRQETIAHEGKSYLVEYYLLGIRTQDDTVADDELMPLVYLNDKLVGMGWDWVQKIKK